MRTETPIGRQPELEALTRAVARSRVVSLTGAPGVGKSAVAVAYARSRPSVYCSLEGVETDVGVCRSLTRALGVAAFVSSPTDAAWRVGRALGDRGRIVLVLDDADLALGALGALVRAWVNDAPQVRVVVAARTRLPGAARVGIAPLDVPRAGERDAQVIARSPAVQCFVRCAEDVKPGYRLSAESARHVASIVRTLAGLPLAIELCAKRVVVLGEREIAADLAEHLENIDASAAATGEKTLGGAFALSWDRLDDDDARALAAFTTFRASFDLDAATAVTGMSRFDAARALERLEDASLVRAFEPEILPDARRYALHTVVRVFAAARLSPDARASANQRHAEHYGAMAERLYRAHRDVLALDRDDLETALTWATRAKKPEIAARVAIALAPLILAHGPLAPFLERVTALVSRYELPRALAAELHLVRGFAKVHQGRDAEGLADLETARKLARAAKSKRTEALATSRLGLVVGIRGQFALARRHLAAAAKVAEETGDPWLRGITSKDLANVLAEEGSNEDAVIALSRARDLFHAARDMREEGFVLMMMSGRLIDDGHLDDARRDVTAAFELLRASGDKRSMGWCQTLLSLVDSEEGDLRSARTRLDGALATFRAIGDAHTEAIVLSYLGNVALEQGAFAEAEGHYRDARALLVEVGDVGFEAMVVATMALVDVALGRPAAARERFALAKKLSRTGRAARTEAIAVLASSLDPTARGAGAGSPRRRRAARPLEEVRFAARAVTSVLARRGAQPDARAVVVARGGEWVVTPDQSRPRRLAGALRGVLARLALDRVRYPGRAVTAAALVRAGWPGEAILPEAAKNRLHVTIARLRRGGLDGLLVRAGDGYFLDPATEIRIDDGDAPSNKRST